MYGLRGIGDTPGAFSFACGGGLDALNPSCWGSTPASSVAPPPAPTGAALTTPPASEADAAALVQSIANQQAVAQKALNAGQVQSSILDTVLGGASSATTAVTDAVTAPFSSWWLIGALAISFAILANMAYEEGVR